MAVNFIFTGLALILTQVNFNLFRGISLNCPLAVSNLLNNGLVGRIFCLGSLSTSPLNAAASQGGVSSSGLVESSELSVSTAEMQSTGKTPISDWSLLAALVDRLLFVTYGLVVLIYHW